MGICILHVIFSKRNGKQRTFKPLATLCGVSRWGRSPSPWAMLLEMISFMPLQNRKAWELDNVVKAQKSAHDELLVGHEGGVGKN